MGGNAFLSIGVKASRINREEYNVIVADVLQRFPKHRQLHACQELREKKDFGDIDFIVLREPREDFSSTLRQIFGKDVLINKNSHFISIIYNGIEEKNVQVDFICVDDAGTFEFSCHLLDWNDTSCILGEIISRCLKVPEGRLKLCDKALKYQLYLPHDNGRKHQEIVLSTNFYEALEVTGFKVEVYKKGFGTAEEVFAFLTDNTYFDPQVYVDFALNSHKTKQMQKRSMRTSFFEHVESLAPVRALEAFPLFEIFPDLPAKIEATKKAVGDAYERKKAITSKFNGHLVRERYSVLPEHMRARMKMIVTSKPQWEDFVFGATEEEVWKHVDELMVGVHGSGNVV
uniref:Nucleotidyltransferase n=1 Tax=Palpitomonas bilix TaxID=652834 RepID=A0A7S3LTD4_9EUKA|mmetsp:Transcript_4568/g.9469  ORF Transcript_4568/g.9469 Transcript_4568/m.9469 type:complete len:344 (+) Transcript_4568:309-1340(+)